MDTFVVNLINVAVVIGVPALFLLHCWCLATLLAWRFRLAARLGWGAAILAVPLIGPVAYLVATRRFRSGETPTGRRQLACFVCVTGVFLLGAGLLGVQQYREFKRRAADAGAYGDIKQARYLVETRIAETGHVPATLAEVGFTPSAAGIHVAFTPRRERGYELSSYHERGGMFYRSIDGLPDIKREPRPAKR